MKMNKMFIIAFFSAMLICSCILSAEDSENLRLLSSPSGEQEPSILNCPPEDVVEYPISDELPNDWAKTTPDGGCAMKIKTSKEELSFSAHGGVRCVTTDRDFEGVAADKDCIVEGPIGPMGYYKKITCPWFTATKIEDSVLHISVNQNESGIERAVNIKLGSLYCSGSALVAQSAK